MIRHLNGMLRSPIANSCYDMSSDQCAIDLWVKVKSNSATSDW